MFIERADVEAETLILWPPNEKGWLVWKDPDAGKGWRPGGEGDDRGWDGWMASPTQWTWVWVSSGSWWWTGRPAVHGVAKSWTWLSDWTEQKDVINQDEEDWKKCAFGVQWWVDIRGSVLKKSTLGICQWSKWWSDMKILSGCEIFNLSIPKTWL